MSNKKTRSQKIEKFMSNNELDSLTICQDSEGNDTERYFSHSGCDICSPLANDVYDCEGYSDKHKEIFGGFQVCHECICGIYNGECDENCD